MKRLLFLGCLEISLLAGFVAASPQEDIYDRSLPQKAQDIPATTYNGIRYKTKVPDTPDLAECAREMVNFLTRAVAPEKCDYATCQIMQFGFNPSIFEIGYIPIFMQPKWIELFPVTRSMSGSTQNLDMDAKMMAALVRTTGTHGLCYQPVKNRPWAYIDHKTEEIGKPFSDMFAEGRQLRAYATWYQHDKNPLWKKLALRKIDRLLDISIPKNNGRYFRMTRGYSPSYKEMGQGPVMAAADVGHVSDKMTGYSAAFTNGWIIRGAATWYKLTGYEPALKLARELSVYLLEDKEFYHPNTHDVPLLIHGHTSVISHALNGLLSYALVAEDQNIINVVKRAYDQYLDLKDPGRTGVVLSSEGCQMGDLLTFGVLLSQTGTGDYWQEVERLLRNTVLPMQITQKDVDRVRAQPLCIAGDPNNTATLTSLSWHLRTKNPINLSKKLPEGTLQFEDGPERCRGGWFVTVDNRGACLCSASCCLFPGVYVAWEYIVESNEDQLKVNMLLNRASLWADIDSYLPYQGKVVIKMKTTKEKVLVRIPRWTNRNQVVCKVGGIARQFQWLDYYNNYIDIGKVAAKDKVTVTFPVKQSIVHVNLPVSHLIDPSRRKECDITLKGNTVIDITPDVMYPMHIYTKYRAEKIGKKTVDRFVSQDNFIWW